MEKWKGRKVTEIELDRIPFSHGIIAENSNPLEEGSAGYNTLALKSLFAEAPKLKMKIK